MNKKIDMRVCSEVGKLKAVLLHQPGLELERLAPEYLEDMLFEDIPWVEKMRKEHEEFAAVLTETGSTVFYVQELIAESLLEGGKEAQQELVSMTLNLCGLEGTMEYPAIEEHLLSLSSAALAEKIIIGLEKRELSFSSSKRPLSHFIQEGSPFYIPPLPNLYFTRDPATVIGNIFSVNTMKTQARGRESALIAFIAAYHAMFRDQYSRVHKYRPNPGHSIEGGDILVLNDKAVAVGCSARTSPGAIEQLAHRLFKDDFRQVLAVQIPSTRAYMHLDTVVTMVDYDAFTIFGGIEKEIKVYRLERDTVDNDEYNGLQVTPLDNLAAALEQALDIDKIRLIKSSGHDALTAAREQWNDSTNTLAVAPGKVITYNRNVNSNRELRANGIEVLEIEGSELVRGRGGPRCMSMPLSRE